MTSTRASRSIVRIAPLLAWLVVLATATPRALAAGCAHPGLETASTRGAASLRILNVADEPGSSWELPGKPCDGPLCRSKAPDAGASATSAAAVDHSPAADLASAFPPPPSSRAIARFEPPVRPIRGVDALERPPRAG